MRRPTPAVSHPAATSLTWNFENMMADRIGVQGMSEDESANAFPLIQQINQKFQEDRKKGLFPFLDLPSQSTEKIDKLVKKVRRFDNFILLGIGGSALGPTALHQALHSP